GADVEGGGVVGAGAVGTVTVGAVLASAVSSSPLHAATGMTQAATAAMQRALRVRPPTVARRPPTRALMRTSRRPLRPTPVGRRRVMWSGTLVECNNRSNTAVQRRPGRRTRRRPRQLSTITSTCARRTPRTGKWHPHLTQSLRTYVLPSCLSQVGYAECMLGVSMPKAGDDYPKDFRQFDEWFATEEDCERFLRRVRWPDGFVCPRCGVANEPWETVRGLLM